MKHKTQLMLLASLSPLLANAALADDSTVTIYGRIHADFENTKSGAATGSSAAFTTNKVQNDTSRIGFKGTEDLGNGLKAIWQVESGVAIDDGSSTGSNTWAGRESFIGLSSSQLGTLKAGNFLVAIDDLHYIAGNNFQYATGISNDATLWANGGSLASGGFDVRAGNSVSYQTPKFNNVTARIQYSLTSGTGGAETATHGATLVSGNLNYDDGQLRVGYGFQQNRSMQQMSSNFYQNGLMHMLAAGYNFGSIYVGGLVEHDILDNINLTGHSRSRNYGSLIGTYTNGANIFSAQYGQAASWKGSAAVQDSGAKMASLAYNRVLSKTTQVYVLLTELHNEANATYVLGGNPSATAAGAAKQHSLAVGMWKNF
ncbi:porin [Aquitalea denitrificans]|uniref:porin n=1 Tax=Aquitalea denitrificans TaxID=519081 RepID=UPI001F0F5B4A|nr:porin [Aquitalea denitrificans]